MEFPLAIFVLISGFLVAMRLPLGSVVSALLTALSIMPLVLLARSTTASLVASFVMVTVQVVVLQRNRTQRR